MGKIVFNPFPRLQTKRLMLNKLSQSDAAGIYALRSTDEVIRFTGIKKYKEIGEAVQYIERMETAIRQNECIIWSIYITSSNSFIGSICFWNISEDGDSAEIGYDLLPIYQGQGYMQEAMKAVIQYGFEGMKLDKIFADLRSDNIKSVKILERNGFVIEKAYKIKNKNDQIDEMAIYYMDKEFLFTNMNNL